MSLSLMMPQKYCGFSTKLESPESSMPSSEEGGLAPKFIKRSETAKSSSFPRTDDPADKKKGNRDKCFYPNTPDLGKHALTVKVIML